MLFPDVSKAVKEAKSLGSVLRQVRTASKNYRGRKRSRSWGFKSKVNVYNRKKSKKSSSLKVTATPDTFVAATLPKHLDFWKSITSNQTVLNIVKSYNIDIDLDLWRDRRSSTS